MADKGGKSAGRRWNLPFVMVLLGMAGALSILICLFTINFILFDLIYYIPALAISTLLIFWGIGQLKNKIK